MMEYAIFKALLFAVALLDGVYLGVLAHGLGHAIMALILTNLILLDSLSKKLY